MEHAQEKKSREIPDAAERREIRRFVFRLAFFVLPLVLAAVVLEVALHRVVNYYETKRAALEKRRESVEVLVLGNSQANFGIDPDELGRPGFNLAMPSQTMIIDGQLVQRYLPGLPKLKTVILAIDYFSVAVELARGIEHWRNHYYIRYFGIDGDGPWSDRLSPRNFSLIALYTPKLVWGFAKEGFRVNSAATLHESGWDEHTVVLREPSTRRESRELLGKQNAMMTLDAVPRNQAVADDLVGALAARGVRVVLLTLPVQPSYREQYDPGFAAAMTGAISRLRAKFGLEYFDYSADARFGFRDFMDPDHLNAGGARKFSRILSREVLK